MSRSLFARPSASAATSIEGVLERVTFSSEENAWSVVKMVVGGKPDLVTAVGNLLGVQPGESLRLSGHWTTDKKYGEQFKVDSYITVKPATLVGIEKYLGSGLVRGVGKVRHPREPTMHVEFTVPPEPVPPEPFPELDDAPEAVAENGAPRRHRSQSGHSSGAYASWARISCTVLSD
jgi:hypothetical protein